ncbi:enoyl-CoA hydratase-related protein [Streptomyces mirabilis]|uniref:enoyl-CoA hydratase-related protein n=1 Tax=Streptomyces mirabilis TaxID=68239 RepID=UPI0036DB571D
MGHDDAQGRAGRDEDGERHPARHAPLRRYADQAGSSACVTIASVHGRVRGAGREFALACDIRLASQSGRFSGSSRPESMPWQAVIPSLHLPRLMGRGWRSKRCSATTSRPSWPNGAGGQPRSARRGTHVC